MNGQLYVYYLNKTEVIDKTEILSPKLIEIVRELTIRESSCVTNFSIRNCNALNVI